MRLGEYRRLVQALGDELFWVPFLLDGDCRSISRVRAGAGGAPARFKFPRTMVSQPRAADGERVPGGALPSYLDCLQRGVGGVHARETCSALRSALAMYLFVTQESLRDMPRRYMQGVSTLVCLLSHQLLPLRLVAAGSYSDESLLCEVSRAAFDQGLLRDAPAGGELEPDRMYPVVPRGCTIAYANLAVKANRLRAPGWGAWLTVRSLLDRVRYI